VSSIFPIRSRLPPLFFLFDFSQQPAPVLEAAKRIRFFQTTPPSYSRTHSSNRFAAPRFRLPHPLLFPCIPRARPHLLGDGHAQRAESAKKQIMRLLKAHVLSPSGVYRKQVISDATF
jgi:hypothetical protein